MRVETDNIKKLVRPKVKQVFLSLLTLIALNHFAMSHSFANEAAEMSKEQLQEIIDLFQDDLHSDAMAQLKLSEGDFIASIADAKDAEAYILLGRAYFYAEMDEKALEGFKAALFLDASLSEAHFFLGLIHRFADDFDSAEQSFRDAIAIKKNDGKYFLELGRTLEIKGDELSASKAYKNALAIEDHNFDANFNLAMIYAAEGKTESTEKHLLAAIEQKPNDIDSHYNLGQLYQNTKQHSLAVKHFKTVVEIDPNDWGALSKLVQVNESLKDYEARDAAIESIYEVWRSGVNEDLSEQGFYIREQKLTENGKIFALEYFELKGPRARKYVFKLQDEQTEELKFDVSLGSYDHTTEFARAKGKIGPDERRYHLDGYGPDRSHYTYAFFDYLPTYETVKELALKALAGEQKTISSTVILK